MFLGAIQPPVVSLFSSTNNDPLRLFSVHQDTSLPADSFVHFLHDETSQPPPAPPGTLICPPLIDDYDKETAAIGYALNQTVLHIQSPTMRTTYIQCPSIYPPMRLSANIRQRSNDLGLKHPWMHLQVRNMGREWSLEVGLVDQAGRIGVLRLSTFQKQPRLLLSGPSPLLHLPLSFPQAASRPLTTWCTLSLNLPFYLRHFSSVQLSPDEGQGSEGYRPNALTQIPSGAYSHISYIRIYATCRLRRIWFDEHGSSHNVPWEFQLYGSEY
ncbi:hypothetical protein AMATHDRAFT_75496 [Amanita thiersii Skay4041]|uniref:CFA20 domain-containing protein n=1 Tax=Amanita thiersii Skay4041 TaxID=703135 RepID=A0A2A9NJ36_9AGAR|nr:hypothetical protein AMATHDRAFT_75496 [Amanita thiersii Skay4041]